MKNIFSILMIIATLLPSMTKVWVLIDFKINQDFIAKVFCINRDKPMTMCHGKCFLYEELKKVEETEQKQASRTLKEKVEIIHFPLENNLLVTLETNTKKRLGTGFDQAFYKSSHTSRLFHPPEIT